MRSFESSLDVRSRPCKEGNSEGYCVGVLDPRVASSSNGRPRPSSRSVHGMTLSAHPLEGLDPYIAILHLHHPVRQPEPVYSNPPRSSSIVKASHGEGRSNATNKEVLEGSRPRSVNSVLPGVPAPDWPPGIPERGGICPGAIPDCAAQRGLATLM